MADTLMLVERPAGHGEMQVDPVAPGRTWQVELGARHEPRERDHDAPPGSLRAPHHEGGSGMTLRDGTVISDAVRRWVSEARRTGIEPTPHDVVVTSRDPDGTVVARWCLRRATPVPVRWRAGRDLVFTCEWIDLLATDSVSAAPAPVFERRRSERVGARHPGGMPGPCDGVVTAG
jgi:hypothetical protein